MQSSPILKFFLIIMICPIILNLNNTYAQTISEGFETGLPASYESIPTDHLLSSGTWTLLNVEQTTSNIHSGSYCAQIKQSGNPGAYAITPSINGVTTVSFWVRGGKSVSGGLLLEKSVNGSAYSLVQSYDITTTVTQYSCVINDPSNNIKIKFETGNLTTLYLDDVLITSSTANISVSKNNLSDFGTIVNGSNSISESYLVSGSNLTEDITITSPKGFKISKDNVTFDSTLTLMQLNGKVDSTLIYVNFSPSIADGTESGNIFNTSGGMTKEVAVSGTAIATEPTNQSAITFGTVTGNSIVVNFSGGNGTKRIIVAHEASDVTWLPTDGSGVGSNSNFSLASDQGNGNKIVYNGMGSTVTVNGLNAGTSYYFKSFEYNYGSNNSENYLTASPGAGSKTTLEVPELITTPSVLSFGNLIAGTNTSEKSFYLKGRFLNPSNDLISLTAPDGYQISTESAGNFSASLNLSYQSGSLDTTVFVKFIPAVIKNYNDSINVAGGGAPSVFVNVIGNGISQEVLPDSTPFGFASCGLGTTGGQGGDTVYITTAQQLNDLITARQKNITTPIVIVISGTLSGLTNEVEIKYQGNETIIGAGSDAKLQGFGLKIWDAFNIVVRNLTFSDCTAGEGDAISIESCNNIWIDHNTFTDSPGSALDESHDGQTDVKKGSYYVTISWNHYMDHRKTCLLGHTESLTSDTVMKVTYYRNWFDGTYSRHPRARFAKAHIINNLYSSVGVLDGLTGGYAIGATCNCQLYVEANYFENTATPTLISGVNDPSGVLSNDPVGYLKAVNNYLVNSGSIVQDTIAYNFYPKDYYSYSAADPSQVKKIVMEGAGVGVLDVSNITSVKELSNLKVPTKMDLLQNYPNPFNPTTTITFQIKSFSHVILKVYNILGEAVKTLVDDNKPAGNYTINFNASSLSSGIYFYRLEAGNYVSVKKMILLK